MLIPKILTWDLIAERLGNDIRTLGAALVVGLVKGCLDADALQFEVNTAADRLVRDGDQITGVEITKDGQIYSSREQWGYFSLWWI